MERQFIDNIETRRKGDTIEHRHEDKMFWHPVDANFDFSIIRDIEMDETMARWPVLYGIMRPCSIPAKRR